MKYDWELLKADLRLFEEAAATGEEGTSHPTAHMDEEAQQERSLEHRVNRQEATEESATQKEGEQVSPKTDEHMPDPAEARQAEFEKLIKGEYKDLFSERVQAIIDKRFKETSQLKERAKQLGLLLEQLGERYGVETDNIEKIMEAIQMEDSGEVQEAQEKGITVPQLRQLKRIEQENAEMRRAMQQRKRLHNAQQTYQQWMEQAENTKKIYPDFELQSECKNSRFVNLLKGGVDMRTAFEVIHKDELIGSAMRLTAQKVAEKVTNSIKARHTRPSENGTFSQSAFVTKTDVSSMSKRQREEIERRALRGEKISF